jgi:small neutral amino acid transporter SnatA (MarC family)
LGAAVGLLENGETMNQATTLFVSTFTTLLAIINPLESLPVFLRLLQGKDEQAHRRVVRRACTYATLLLFFFLIFGTLLLEIFEVPLSMGRIVGGIILMRVGFSLFMPAPRHYLHCRLTVQPLPPPRGAAPPPLPSPIKGPRWGREGRG